jgi:hypothetical protein
MSIRILWDGLDGVARHAFSLFEPSRTQQLGCAIDERIIRARWF